MCASDGKGSTGNVDAGLSPLSRCPHCVHDLYTHRLEQLRPRGVWSNLPLEDCRVELHNLEVYLSQFRMFDPFPKEITGNKNLKYTFPSFNLRMLPGVHVL